VYQCMRIGIYKDQPMIQVIMDARITVKLRSRAVNNGVNINTIKVVLSVVGLPIAVLWPWFKFFCYENYIHW
jgi:hypothetical protein